MLTHDSLAHLQDLLGQQDLDGWLLFDFKGRNPIATAVLGDRIIGTRRVFVLVPKAGVPTAFVHEIDAELWREWPRRWRQHIWVSQGQLEQLLANHVTGLRLAVDYSPRGASPYLDCVPVGMMELLRQFAFQPVPSVELVTRFLSVWTKEECRSHDRAATAVSKIARQAMKRVADTVHKKQKTTEYDVAIWIRNAFDLAGLISESGPSICMGANAARNHYEPTAETASVIVRKELLLIDLWAKEPGGIYADQTWMMCVGQPSERDAGLWQTVRDSRDAALQLLTERIKKRLPVTGAEVDSAAREVIANAGLEKAVAGRTGHSIDRFGLHGFGPTIDGTETGGGGLLIPGVGFSVEPGVYLKGETGVRSEVNVHILQNDLVITPRNYQTDLMVL